MRMTARLTFEVDLPGEQESDFLDFVKSVHALCNRTEYAAQLDTTTTTPDPAVFEVEPLTVGAMIAKLVRFDREQKLALDDGSEYFNLLGQTGAFASSDSMSCDRRPIFRIRRSDELVRPKND